MSAYPATDWGKILDTLGPDRRLLIQHGVYPGTVEVRVEEHDRSGARASCEVSRDALAHAAFDMIGYAVDHCVRKINELRSVAS